MTAIVMNYIPMIVDENTFKKYEKEFKDAIGFSEVKIPDINSLKDFFFKNVKNRERTEENYISILDSISEMLPSIYLQRKKEELKEIFDTLSECSEKNWDGYGALPISLENALMTINFLELLPPNIDKPEIIPEPPGTIGLQWSSKSCDLIIGLNKNIIIFAMVYSDGTSYSGTSEYSDEIPETILQKIYKANNDTNTED